MLAPRRPLASLGDTIVEERLHSFVNEAVVRPVLVFMGAFRGKSPDIARGLTLLIERQHRASRRGEAFWPHPLAKGRARHRVVRLAESRARGGHEDAVAAGFSVRCGGEEAVIGVRATGTLTGRCGATLGRWPVEKTIAAVEPQLHLEVQTPLNRLST